MLRRRISGGIIIYSYPETSFVMMFSEVRAEKIWNQLQSGIDRFGVTIFRIVLKTGESITGKYRGWSFGRGSNDPYVFIDNRDPISVREIAELEVQQ